MRLVHSYYSHKLTNVSRHIHVSLRNAEGKNIFAASDSNGRSDSAYKDTKFISEEAESFLAGILDGIADGKTSSFTLYRYSLSPRF